MADDADLASDEQQAAIDRAIKRVVSCVSKPTGAIIVRDCAECGNSIPLARLGQVPNATRCFECQRAFELDSKQYRRF